MGKTEVPPPVPNRWHCVYWIWDGEEGCCQLDNRLCEGNLGWCSVRINEMNTIEYLEQKSW